MRSRVINELTLVSFAAVVALQSWSGVARAQGPKPSVDASPEGTQGEGVVSAESALRTEGAAEASRVILLEARGLAVKGDYAAACPKFEQARRLEDGAGIRFDLADCLERLGRTASAYRLFVEVAEVSDAAAQDQRAAVAKERANLLAPRLSHVVVEVDERDIGLGVLLDGQALEQSEWGEPRAIDPGEHMVEALDAGEQRWMLRFRVPETTSAVIVTVPRLLARRQAVVAHPSDSGDNRQRATANAVQPLAPPAPLEGRPKAGFGVYGWLLLGTGAAALGTSAVLAYLYRDSNREAEGICPESVGCGRAEIRRHDDLVGDARVALTGAWIGLGVGVTALGGAAIIRVLRDEPGESAPNVAATRSGWWLAGPAILGGNNLGLEAQGTW